MEGCFRRRQYVGRYIQGGAKKSDTSRTYITLYERYHFFWPTRYVCEQLPGTNSSPIVTKLRQLYPWPQGAR